MHLARGTYRLCFLLEGSEKAHQDTGQFSNPFLRLVMAEMPYHEHSNVVSQGNLYSLYQSLGTYVCTAWF